MQNIKYNNKDYIFFNTKEHFIKEKITYPIKQYDGYEIISISNDEIYYINTLPVIVETSSINLNYNIPGNIFLDIDYNESFYEINTHEISLSSFSYLHGLYSKEETSRLKSNYKIYFHNNNSSSTYYTNIVPIIVSNDLRYKPGMSLEENASLKLKKYTI